MNCKVSHICPGYNPRLSSYTVSPLPLEKGSEFCCLLRPQQRGYCNSLSP